MVVYAWSTDGATKGVCINHQVGHSGLGCSLQRNVGCLCGEDVPAEVLGVKGEDAAQAQTTISDYYTANPDVNGYLTLGPADPNPSMHSWKPQG